MEAQGDREGIYLLSSSVNKQPSWFSESCGCGIWYVQHVRRWMIGPLESFGEENGGIESNPELGSKLKHPFDIMDWNYHTENGWMPSNGIDEIIIECIDKEDHSSSGSSSNGHSSSGHSSSGLSSSGLSSRGFRSSGKKKGKTILGCIGTRLVGHINTLNTYSNYK